MTKIVRPMALFAMALLLGGCDGQPTDEAKGVNNLAGPEFPVSSVLSGARVTDGVTSFAFEGTVDASDDQNTDPVSNFTFEFGFNRALNSAR